MNKTSNRLIESMDICNDKLTIKVSNILKSKYVKDDFWIKITNVDLGNIPLQIQIIPFILNIAPVIWVSGLTFEIDEMDKNLEISLIELKKALSNMYPKTKWDGKLISKNRIDLSYNHQENNSVLLFSGGLDSVATSYRHIDENQTLVTVMGSDVTLADIEGWKKVKNNTIEYAKTINAKYYFVESNFMDFLNHTEISNIAEVPNWWAYVQHGMGLSSLMAVPAYITNSTTGYIASSHSVEFTTAWGSDPKIDNYIKWANLHIEHDCYDLTRQGKIELVTEKVKNGYPTPYLRVCYSSVGGENCGYCEKCCRTMSGLIVSGVNFRDYGFNQTDLELISNVKNGLKSQKFHFEDNTLFHWQDIQSKIQDMNFYNTKSEEILNYISWLKNFDFRTYKEKQKVKRVIIKKTKSIIKIIPGLFPLLKSIKNIVKVKNK